jgi:hypothetical protein
MPTPSPQELFDRLVARLAAEPYRTAGSRSGTGRWSAPP